MSYIGKNIKKIRTTKNLNQTQFAELFSLKRTSIGAYEEGRSEPKTDTLIQIANYFDISIDALLTKEITINDLLHFDIFKEELLKKDLTHNAPNDILKNQGVEMAYIQSKNTLEYILKRKDKKYLLELPTIKLPFKLNITTRAFEQHDATMCVKGQGINQGDIIIGIALNKQNWHKLETKKNYVFIDQQKTQTLRLIDVNENSFICQPDNSNFSKQEIKADSLVEIWKVIGIYSTNIQHPNLLDDRLASLEKKVDSLLRNK